MGDVVISTSFFEDICRAFPDAEIDLNVGKAFAGLFAGDTRFCEVIESNFKGKDRHLAGLLAWALRMRRNRYDLVFDLQSNDRSRLLLSMLRISSIRAPRIVGLHARYPYHLAPPPGTVAGLGLQISALQSAGVPHVTPRPVLQIPAGNRIRAERFLSDNGVDPGGYGIFLPGSQAGGEIKRWGWKRYADLALLLDRSGLGPAIMLGGPDDVEECEKAANSVNDPGVLINLCGRTEILDVLPLVENSRFVVGNDTGTAHIASCTDRPIIVICGPTDPKRVKPVGDNVVAMQAELPCVNCYRKECDTRVCMEMITPEMVHERLQQLLA